MTMPAQRDDTFPYPPCPVCGVVLFNLAYDGWCQTCAIKALKDILAMRALPREQRSIIAEILRYAQAPFVAKTIMSEGK